MKNKIIITSDHPDVVNHYEQLTGKEKVLRKLGWRVYRFTNKEVLTKIEKCLNFINTKKN